ncbi:hypothetical protein M2451_000539 [Dysgonomonas sp. PFB1-18]|uniref:SH3 beta-barrel fold-containing protein n=1 Tax=unclassified Dysgonomonas TaxID=2630389 RepID=UPI002475A41A|nr:MULTISPECIES: SH3 beta-barrel fold-containing protein [unclassified Dysgonomonas]MDH6307390.1 hypothetical protein [Dysgonomonas sp. PF1-14]MDH6337308.1 hypothetical protein [Dysgonomonas sp. PF1-16]MDH6379232.1 hypothetical protein [Dysgonomonas sp. PFB1-18]MDH6396130.1 hypothetical protein [Dysgonomonas sp. PF1-23]
MKTTMNNLALLNRATNMVLNGYNLNQSLQKSAMIEALQFQLVNGTAHFLYRKKDGSIREAFGTLLEKVVDRNINGFGMPRKYYNCQAYFDIELQTWRSFKYENLIAILD